MRIGSGVSQISTNLYVRPRYPSKPIETINKIHIKNFDPVTKLGTLEAMKAITYKQISPSIITLSIPDGSFIVGYYIDMFA